MCTPTSWDREVFLACLHEEQTGTVLISERMDNTAPWARKLIDMPSLLARQAAAKRFGGGLQIGWHKTAASARLNVLWVSSQPGHTLPISRPGSTVFYTSHPSYIAHASAM